jgi:hypothetical protein
MFKSTVSDIVLPLIIPRRGKGHFDASGKISITSSGFHDSLEFIRHLEKFGKETCTNETPGVMASTLITELGLSDIALEITFSYPLERLSPSYGSVFYDLCCGYTFSLKNGLLKTGMFIELPVRIKDFYTKLGVIRVDLFDISRHFYFEDVVDLTTKAVDIKLHPLSSVADKDHFFEFADDGNTVYSYLTGVGDYMFSKGVSQSGQVSIKTRDIYGIYSYEQLLKWVC